MPLNRFIVSYQCILLLQKFRMAFFYSILLGTTGSYSYGQSKQQPAFSLVEAQRYAVSNVLQLKKIGLDDDLARQRYEAKRATLYPQANGTLDLRWNAVRPTNILPGTLAGLPADQNLSVQFGTLFNLTPQLDVTYNVLDPTRKINLQLEALNEKLAQNTSAQSEFDVRMAVKKAYYAVLLQRLRIKLAEDNLKRAQAFLQDGEARMQEGRLVKADLDRLRLTAANRETELKKSRQSYEQSLLTLKYRMGYALDSAIVLSDTLLITPTAPVPPALADTASIRTNRLEFKNLAIQQEQDQLTSLRIRRAYLPSLNFYSAFAVQGFRDDLNFFESNTWFGNIYLGLRLNVPVFDGFLKKAQLAESRLALQRRKLEAEQLAFDTRYNAVNAWQGLRIALQNLEIQQNNRELAKSVRSDIELRLAEGRALGKEFIDADIALVEADTNYLVAVYEATVYLLDWEQTIGRDGR
jgi:outer membrane protein TolC